MSKKKFLLILVLAVAMVAFLGCTRRITDFTIISSKNVNVPGERGSRTTGKDCAWSVLFVPGTPNMKEAMDNSIENAGSEYDALLDGVVKSKFYYFVLASKSCYIVEGTAVNTEAKSRGYQSSNIYYHSSVSQNKH